MFVSLKWIRDFVDLPTDLDVRALAERLTLTTAEVEGVEEITCDAAGLVAAEILAVDPIPGSGNLYAVRVSVGDRQFESVTIAEGLQVGDRVIYAPLGAKLPGIGEVGERQTEGRTSAGMIVPGDALAMPTIGQRAIWLPPNTTPGEVIDLDLLHDWVIEIDNKSITHRPDLWGHYGIAREVAAICKQPLKPYPVVPIEELNNPELPAIPITIDNPDQCPRYSALRFSGVRSEPGPLWMQTRLAHVGLRPIDILVDLTNYIMAELGQPMHAFDGSDINQIEVATAAPGDKFTTLDGFERTMPDGALMIQCHRRSVALAGIMGGADTEVTNQTESLLLESANFEPAVIRRCAVALTHRTDASARFEKSLDPHHTVLAIQRFVHLARPQLPSMTLTSRLSDAFPNEPVTIRVTVDPKFVGQYVGRPVPAEEIIGILEPLEFAVTRSGPLLEVTVPSFRATKDISIEADVIEEVARFIGYDAITPALPTVTVRYAEPAPITRLERETLTHLCQGGSYAEIHRYLWFDNEWLKVLSFDPGETVVMRNPSAHGMERLRTTLIPGILSAVDLNRHHHERFDLLEIGSVILPGRANERGPEDNAISGGPNIHRADDERRHLGLAVVAPGRKAAHEDQLLRRLKSDLEAWCYQHFNESLRFEAALADAPWEHAEKTANVCLDGKAFGRITVVPAAIRRKIDEHLAAWSIALAEIDLTAVAERPPKHRKLAPVPTYPQVDLDFSLLADSGLQYATIADHLGGYDHALLKRLSFVDSYEGGSVPTGKRSFTFRATIGHDQRTLTEEDSQGFRSDFLAFAEKHGLTLRSS